MAYGQPITRDRPAYVLFLVDQSAGMTAPVDGGASSKATSAAAMVNRSLLTLARLSTGGADVGDCFDVSVLTYGGRGGVNSGLMEPADGRWIFGIRELAFHPLRVETEAVQEDEGSAVAPSESQVPVWLEPVAAGSPTLCAALEVARKLVVRWAKKHPLSFPPVVMTIAGSAASDGDPAPLLQSLSLLGTESGNVLLFHCLIGAGMRPRLGFRVRAADLPDDAFMHGLFQLSSAIPESIRVRATEAGHQIDRGARGFLLDGDAADLVEVVYAGCVQADAPQGATGWARLLRPVVLLRRAFSGRADHRDPSVADTIRNELPARAGSASEPEPKPPRVVASIPTQEGGFLVHRLLLPKQGNRPRQCEDAIACDLSVGRFVVTDGASEGRFSRFWARLLALGWVRGGDATHRCSGDADAETLHAGITSLDQSLRRHISVWRERLRARQGGRLLYFQANPSTSEFAAFLGLELDQGEWRALAVGDCCLFVEREEDFLSFPIASPEDFSSRVHLVPSAIGRNLQALDNVERASGCYGRGDRFLLMSDAIACWYLTHAERRSALCDLLTADRKDAAADLIAAERASNRLRDDDVAIVLVEIGEAT